MLINLEDKKPTETPRKIKWGHHVLEEAKQIKSPPSQYLLDWWAEHPQCDPRNKK